MEMIVYPTESFTKASFFFFFFFFFLLLHGINVGSEVNIEPSLTEGRGGGGGTRISRGVSGSSKNSRN